MVRSQHGRSILILLARKPVELFLAGDFDLAPSGISNFARWNGAGWSSVPGWDAAIEPGAVRALEWAGSTALFIRPPYEFRVVEGLLTNFHLPRSTLLMLVAAFAGYERIMSAYGQAAAHGYRFYSYGDAMVVPPPGESS